MVSCADYQCAACLADVNSCSAAHLGGLIMINTNWWRNAHSWLLISVGFNDSLPWRHYVMTKHRILRAVCFRFSVECSNSRRRVSSVSCRLHCRVAISRSRWHFVCGSVRVTIVIRHDRVSWPVVTLMGWRWLSFGAKHRQRSSGFRQCDYKVQTDKLSTGICGINCFNTTQFG